MRGSFGGTSKPNTDVQVGSAQCALPLKVTRLLPVGPPACGASPAGGSEWGVAKGVSGPRSGQGACLGAPQHHSGWSGAALIAPADCETCAETRLGLHCSGVICTLTHRTHHPSSAGPPPLTPGPPPISPRAPTPHPRAPTPHHQAPTPHPRAPPLTLGTPPFTPGSQTSPPGPPPLTPGAPPLIPRGPSTLGPPPLTQEPPCLASFLPQPVCATALGQVPPVPPTWWRTKCT